MAPKIANPKRLPQGWRLGILLNVLFAVAVLIINFSVTIWAIATSSAGDWDRRKLYEGSCSKTKIINIVGHVLINAFSTVLLSASNYCMQCVSAPNREEVDRAHRKRRWLDVGTPSARNLGSIRPAKAALWFFIGASSLPLHLFYNSALFASFSPSEYTVVTAVERFTQPNGPGYQAYTNLQNYDDRGLVDGLRDKALSGQLDRLENAECLAAYAQAFQSSRSHLILVQDGDPGTLQSGDVGRIMRGTYLFDNPCGATQAFHWMCDGQTSSCEPCEEVLSGARADPSSWIVLGRPVRYCLSERAPDQCKVYFNTTIAVLVNSINAAKVAAFILVFFMLRSPPLLTIGDAVASFMENPDETTRGIGVVSKRDFASVAGTEDETWLPPPKPWAPSRKRWVAAVGVGRVISSVLLYVVLLAGCMFMLLMSLADTGDTNSVLSIGFGTADSRTLISFSEIEQEGSIDIIAAILIANSPQPIISAAYFIYNSLFTAMAMASEWDSYASQRKGLRVSSGATGAQRGSHLLQLPYRFAVPLMVLSGLLHWAASQSIFLVDVEVTRTARKEFISTCGYSPLAIMCFICLGVVMVFALVALSFRRFKTGMPVAGNCSAAISAACHLPSSVAVPGASQMPLQWGEVLVQQEVALPGGNEGGKGATVYPVRRCAFSHEAVSTPVPGVTYY